MSAITDKYAALGGPSGFLGEPTTSELTTPDGRGRYTHYQNGSIYWSPDTGAFEVHGLIRAKWAELGWERSFLGYPVTDETATSDSRGRYNHFQHGSIYWTPETGAHEVHGAVRQKWAALGWERSPIGYPVTDETPTPVGVGRYNHFEHGSIYWTPGTGAWEVRGLIRAKWAELGWERSGLGYPTSDEIPTSDGALSRFQYGVIKWTRHDNTAREDLGAHPQGLWEFRDAELDFAAVHAAVLHTGRVLFFSYDPAAENDVNRALWQLWDPNTGPLPSQGLGRNLFCSGHSFLRDGRLLVAGGQSNNWYPFTGRGADHDVHTFDPVSESWTRHSDMPGARYYPTCVTLADGTVLIANGAASRYVPFIVLGSRNVPNDDVEVFDWRSDALSPPRRFNPGHMSELYPFMKLLPDGSSTGVLFVFCKDEARLYDSASDTWNTTVFGAQSRFNRNYPRQGSCVLLPLRGQGVNRLRILVIGGAGGEDHDSPATDTAEVFEFHPENPSGSGWRMPWGGGMRSRRFMGDAVLLPDGTVLVVNGAGRGSADHSHDPVLEVEVFDPTTETWRLMTPIRNRRLYHSSAILLPDGRVLVGGNTEHWNPDNPTEDKSVELFSPPYLFRGVRPVIQAVPSEIGYDQVFSVAATQIDGIRSAVLMRPCSVTHTNDMDQRCVELTIVGRAGGELSVRSPDNGTFAPPGYYMLCLLNEDGVPSIARFVDLRRSLPTGPTAGGNDMQPGEVLAIHQPIGSPNGWYTFVFQSDGNLVLYKNYRDRDRGVLWASGTGQPVGVCIMQGDGNLVIYDAAAQPVWASDTAQYPGSRLVVQDDGNVVIYRPDGAPVWATHTVQGVLPGGPTAQGDDMQPGEVLAIDQPIGSSNGWYTFVFQGDGNLVLYKNYRDRDRGVLWASATGGPVGVCIMQGDGNLVIYNADAVPVWSSDTAQYPASRLVVQDDGNVVIYRPDGGAVWATHTVQGALPGGPAAQGDDMQPGEVLPIDQPINSVSGRYTFVFQGDGNLVLYKNHPDRDREPLWASATGGPVGVCIMQGDGNLVIYNADAAPVWASDTARYPGSRLVVQDDGNVVIYRPDGTPVWATHTN